jgi:hypothetical protein
MKYEVCGLCAAAAASTISFLRRGARMEDPEDSLTIQYGAFKATALGRFAVIAVLAFLLIAVAGAGVTVGFKLVDLTSGNYPSALDTK